MYRIALCSVVLVAALGVARPAKAELRKEWYGFQLVGGNFGLGLNNNICLLEWQWFYVLPLRISGGGGGPGFSGATPNSAWYAKGGPMFGVPIHLGKADEHVIRLGTGISGGCLHNEDEYTINGYYDTYINESYGPFVEVEAYYEYRFRPHLAVIAGFQATIVVRYEQKNDFDVNGPQSIFGGVAGMAF